MFVQFICVQISPKCTLLSSHSAKHQQRPRIIAGLPRIGQSTLVLGTWSVAPRSSVTIYSKSEYRRNLNLLGKDMSNSDNSGNSAIRSVDPEKPAIEPNMRWIGWPVAEISPIFPCVCAFPPSTSRESFGDGFRIAHPHFLFIFNSDCGSIWLSFRSAWADRHQTPGVGYEWRHLLLPVQGLRPPNNSL